jgi:hypothetical protein
MMGSRTCTKGRGSNRVCPGDALKRTFRLMTRRRMGRAGCNPVRPRCHAFRQQQLRACCCLALRVTARACISLSAFLHRSISRRGELFIRAVSKEIGIRKPVSRHLENLHKHYFEQTLSSVQVLSCAAALAEAGQSLLPIISKRDPIASTKTRLTCSTGLRKFVYSPNDAEFTSRSEPYSRAKPVRPR